LWCCFARRRRLGILSLAPVALAAEETHAEVRHLKMDAQRIVRWAVRSLGIGRMWIIENDGGDGTLQSSLLVVCYQYWNDFTTFSN